MENRYENEVAPFDCKDRKAFDDWLAVNQDAYSRRCFTFAAHWANLMEKKMVEGAAIGDCADACCREADTDGITGFMYGMAVAILSKCWIHGEDLRVWHNLKIQLGTEGEEANKKGTVLNPALLKVQG